MKGPQMDPIAPPPAPGQGPGSLGPLAQAKSEDMAIGALWDTFGVPFWILFGPHLEANLRLRHCWGSLLLLLVLFGSVASCLGIVLMLVQYKVNLCGSMISVWTFL